MRFNVLLVGLLFSASLQVMAGESDLPTDIIKLGAPDPAMRDGAAKNIAALLKETAAAAKRPFAKDLLVQLEDTDPAKHAEALKQLVNALDTLRKAAAQMQAEAMKAIASADPEEKKKGLTFFIENINNSLERGAINADIEKLASPDPKVVEAAQKRLLENGEESAPYIASSLDDERAVVKRACFELLKTLGHTAKSAANDLQFLLDSDDKSARRAAATLLEGLGPDAVEVVDDLVMYLDNDEKSVRRSAANILKKMGPAAKEAASNIADLLDNEDKQVRTLATDILINMGPAAKGANETLAGLVNETKNDADVRERAASVLASIGKEAAPVLELIKKSANDPDPTVKNAVEAAIKTIQK